MENFVTAAHARGKGREPDSVFAVLKKANDDIARLGRDKVISAVIGSIYDDDGKFVTLPSVIEYFRHIPDDELMNYAPIAGLPDFLEAVIEFTFQGYRPENMQARAVSTPGGTGAIRNAIYNYAELKDTVLIPDWFWGPYRTISEEHGIKVDTYEMFDKNNHFTLASIKEKSAALLAVQDNLVIVFNTPGHNPTGYSMTEQDWSELLAFYKECAGNEKKKIVLVLDLAYIDYVGTSEETRKFMKLLGDLPKNILVLMAFSMSKSFTMYGMRSGALIALTSSPEEAEEFFCVNSYSGRGVWSNGARGAQKLLAEVMKNPALKAKIDAERAVYRELISRRADIFLKEANEVGLAVLPYHGGFFITVPAKDPKGSAEKLAQDHIYVVPLKKGLRFAVCALPTYQIPGLAAKTKAAL